MKVYLVINEYVVEGEKDFIIEVCGTYEKAKEVANAWIAEEKQTYWKKAFNIYDELTVGYDIDQGNDFWEVWILNDYANNRVAISIDSREVK